MVSGDVHMFRIGSIRVSYFLLLIVGLVAALLSGVLLGLRTHAEGTGGAGGATETITITDSGSTNTPGSTLTINPDGSGSLHYEKGHWSFGQYINKTFSAHTFDSSKFAAIMAELKGVHAIPNHGCPKSISFGSIITMTYRGQTSGDISCLSMSDGKLLHDLRTLVLNTYASIAQH
ncbi:MAG: hypothetical protein PVSMB5_37470 [Ktedonobacteraceae bacterium]